jgi:NTE family protein
MTLRLLALLSGVGLGLLKGHAFERIIESMLPVKTFDSCISPLGVSAYDILTFSMKSITHGNLAPALRASATFPGLFQPVSHDQGFLIDGGIKDVAGK